MTRVPFDSLMDLWVDKDYAAVAERLGSPSVRAGVREFKRHCLFPYALRVLGFKPYKDRHYRQLKECWRKERAQVEDLV